MADYQACSTIAGALVPSTGDVPVVGYRSTVRGWNRLVLLLLVAVNAVTAVAFLSWLLLPAHIPSTLTVGGAGWQLTVARVSFCLVILVEALRVVQAFSIWLFALNAKDPIPMPPAPGLRIAVLTTIVPGKEPIEDVARTLTAMKRIDYDGEVDVWILDEGDDPEVKRVAAQLEVRHFTRKGRREYNQPTGPYRARTKSGNHNAWRAEHEDDYDIVAQMDPDHVPFTCFLERLVGYFSDLDVAFVVSPQVYGNERDNWVAHGSSTQQCLFSGVVERGGNGLNAPVLIGTNHAYRPAAWKQIGGYQDSIIEDHLTGIRVMSQVNPGSGNYWKGVYSPDVLAIGGAPTTWTDYFNQQRRWAYGIWEILLSRRLRTGPRLPRLRQRLVYSLLQSFYPSVAMTMMLGNAATAVYFSTGVPSMQVSGREWLVLWSASMGGWALLWVRLRRFSIAPHERRELGLAGMTLALCTGPIYVAAAVTALLRRPLAYAVTAKGALSSRESIATFRLHLLWAAAAAALLAASFVHDRAHITLRIWASITLLACLTPPMASTLTAIFDRRRQRKARPAALLDPGTDVGVLTEAA